ncbi:hypothetical protein DLM75_20160 [Leptospira stimsonii]|uniref:Uncharacterized protein n=1 Tax=Leptospira stimsonii TaxID=2202203 RepID=A0A396YV93_9LEPT|nr:hypothetical protein DLM75_20160 [Leptospira stimsonii]
MFPGDFFSGNYFSSFSKFSSPEFVFFFSFILPFSSIRSTLNFYASVLETTLFGRIDTKTGSFF